MLPKPVVDTGRRTRQTAMIIARTELVWSMRSNEKTFLPNQNPKQLNRKQNQLSRPLQKNNQKTTGITIGCKDAPSGSLTIHLSQTLFTLFFYHYFIGDFQMIFKSPMLNKVIDDSIINNNVLIVYCNNSSF
jgi:hypothetical protein